MSSEQPETLPPERELALAHSPAAVRDALTVYLWLDQRIARIIGQASEPMLAQVRLAWWRDMLGTPPDERPQGDVVLDGISAHWIGNEAPLTACVDGWERFLDEPPLKEAAAIEFAEGRAAPFLALAESPNDAAKSAAKRWALVDAALHVESEQERQMLLDLAADLPKEGRLQHPLRGLSVLEALARRSLARGGRPLMEGRAAALVATRAAIFGR